MPKNYKTVVLFCSDDYAFMNPGFIRAENTDWLVRASQKPVVLEKTEDDRLVLSNGLIRRAFCTAPDFTTIDLENLSSVHRIIRGVKPEALLEIDGVQYSVGGLSGQEEYGFFLPDWLKTMQADPKAFHFKKFESGEIKERFGWKRTRHEANLPWPPPGKERNCPVKPILRDAGR